MRGFDPDEVMAFLDIISMEYENLVHQNSMMNEKLAMLETQLKKFRNMETALQDTLLSAERSREETMKIAKKQAEIIVREAEIKAASILDEGQNALVRLRNSFNELKMHKDTYLAKLKALVTAQAELFTQLSFNEERAFERIGEKVVLSSEDRKQAQSQKYSRRSSSIEDEKDTPQLAEDIGDENTETE